MGFDPFSHPARLQGSPLNPDVVYFEDWLLGGYTSSGGGGTKIDKTADVGEWLVTETNDGTITIADDEPGGWLHVTTDTGDNDKYEFQLNGEGYKIQVGKPLVFAARLKFTAAAAPLTSIDWFMGLATTDTTVLAGVTEAIGFGSYEASTPGLLNAGGASIHSFTGNAMTDWTTTAAYTVTDTTIDYVDDTPLILSFEVIAKSATDLRVKHYVNGVKRSETTANVPIDDAITPTFSIQNNAAAAKQMLVDWIYVKQAR